MSFFSTASSSAPAAAPADKDVEVAEPPSDSISSLAFSPQADYLAVGSWDNNVGCIVLALRGRNMNYFSPVIGQAIRGWCERTDARKGDVWPPRPRVERVLEQGTLCSPRYWGWISLARLSRL